MPDQFGINWRYFSLSQVNHPDGNGWRVWEQPLKDPEWRKRRYAASLLAFWSAEAARRQGKEAFRRFHLALLRARHQRGQALSEPATLLAAAGSAGLDAPEFEGALTDASCLERLAADHTNAVSLGVFGTPTLAFPGAEPVYLKLKSVLTPQEGLDFWQVLRSTAVDRPYVLEIKRPH